MLFSGFNSSKRAIAYYRHSAEDKQENSVPIQRDHAKEFSLKHDMQIIHEEKDEGVSGLTSNRPGFQRLFNDWVLNPKAPPFDYILVLDVSRWGRFQNQNEAAYFEYQCQKNGKQVIYISQGFPKKDNEVTASIMTPIERWMAAHYSRQLSEKVWFGSMKVSKEGFSAGGLAPYGMGRLLLDSNKNPIRILKKGEHKQIANERVILTPLDDETTQTVKDIFDLFVTHYKTTNEVADILNERNIPTATGKKWSTGSILRILNNETYIGTKLYNKTWGRLKQKSVLNPRNDWVVTPNAFPAIVDSNIYYKAQERLFWIMPTRWKKGVYAVKRASNLIEQEIASLLIKEVTSEDLIEKKIKEIPFTYSVVFYDKDIPRRCFVIQEQMRNYDYIFAISINIDQRELVDKIFRIPVKDFSENNFMIFSENEDSFSKYMINTDEALKYVTDLIGSNTALIN